MVLRYHLLKVIFGWKMDVVVNLELIPQAFLHFGNFLIREETILGHVLVYTLIFIKKTKTKTN